MHDYDDPGGFFYYDNEDDFDGIDDAETYFTTITIDLCRGGIFYEHIYSKSKVIKGNKSQKRENTRIEK